MGVDAGSNLLEARVLNRMGPVEIVYRAYKSPMRLITNRDSVFAKVRLACGAVSVRL